MDFVILEKMNFRNESNDGPKSEVILGTRAILK